MTRWCTICDECDGTGERDWLEGGCCYACGGSGLEPVEDDYPFPTPLTPAAREPVGVKPAGTGDGEQA